MTDTGPTEGDDSSAADAEPPADAAPEDGALAARVETLESEVDRLSDVVERQRRAISFLTAYADLEPLEAAECPDCGARALTKRSGLTWSKALCTNCGADWVLDR